MLPECAHCGELIEGEPYDPGCSYGCGFKREQPPACHRVYCDSDCHWSAGETGDQRAYERFHEGL